VLRFGRGSRRREEGGFRAVGRLGAVGGRWEERVFGFVGDNGVFIRYFNEGGRGGGWEYGDD